MLFENDLHPLEASDSFVALREVKKIKKPRLREFQGSFGPSSLTSSFESIELSPGLAEGGNHYQPVPVWFGGIKSHPPCRNRGVSLFGASWGIAEGEELIIVGAVLLKDTHDGRHSDLYKYIIVRKIAVALCTGADNDMGDSFPSGDRRLGRHEVCNRE